MQGKHRHEEVLIDVCDELCICLQVDCTEQSRLLQQTQSDESLPTLPGYTVTLRACKGAFGYLWFHWKHIDCIFVSSLRSFVNQGVFQRVSIAACAGGDMVLFTWLKT